jgi:hypothetical protein
VSMTMDQLVVTVSKFEADGHELPSANRRMICANAASEACRKRDFAQALACLRLWGEADDEDTWSISQPYMSCLPYLDVEEPSEFTSHALRAFLSPGFLENIQKGNTDFPVILCQHYLEQAAKSERSIATLGQVAVETVRTVTRIARVVYAVGSPEPLSPSLDEADLDAVFPNPKSPIKGKKKVEPRIALLKDSVVTKHTSNTVTLTSDE